MINLKKCLLTVVNTTMIACATSAMAEQLDHYNDVKSAVTAGKSIRIVVNYEKCTNRSLQKLAGNRYAVFTPNKIAISNDNTIGTYLLYFTMQDGLFPGKPVYQYGNYVISQDDSVSITWTILNAADYSQLGNTLTTSCKLGESAIVYSARREDGHVAQ